MLDRREILFPGFKRPSDPVPTHFSDFSPFVNLTGLPEDTAKRLLEYISKLFESTGQRWHPGGCLSWPLIAYDARQTLEASELGKGFRFELKVFGELLTGRETHCWGALIGTACELVIDPFGLPPQSSLGGNFSLYAPFFGLPQNVPSLFAKSVYLQGRFVPRLPNLT